MKRLSDYTGDAAIELWADMLEPLTGIFSDPSVAEVVQSGKPLMLIAKEILKAHKTEVVQILTRIDDAPITGLNLILRLVNLLSEFKENDEIKAFFGFGAQVKTDSVSSGSVMENTEVAEN